MKCRIKKGSNKFSIKCHENIKEDKKNRMEKKGHLFVSIDIIIIMVKKVKHQKKSKYFG